MPHAQEAIGRRKHMHVETRHWDDDREPGRNAETARQFRLVQRDHMVPVEGPEGQWMDFKALCKLVATRYEAHRKIEQKLLKGLDAVGTEFHGIGEEPGVVHQGRYDHSPATAEVYQGPEFLPPRNPEDVEPWMAAADWDLHDHAGAHPPHWKIGDEEDSIPSLDTLSFASGSEFAQGLMMQPALPPVNLKTPGWKTAISVGATITSIVGIYAAYKAYRWYTKEVEGTNPVEEQGRYSEPAQVRKVVVNRGRIAAQGASEISSWGQCVQGVRVSAGGKSMAMNCIHVGRTLLVPLHLVYAIGAPDKFLVEFMRWPRGGGEMKKYTFEAKMDDLFNIRIDDQTWDLTSIPLLAKEAPTGPSLAKAIAEAETPARSLVTLVNRDLRTGQLSERTAPAERDAIKGQYSSSELTILTNNQWVYDIPTAAGDCGGMLIGHYGGSSKVLGLHIASQHGIRGIACAIDKGLYKDLVQGEIPGTDVQPQGIVDELEDCHLYTIDAHSSQHRIRQNPKTHIIPSLLHDLYGPVTQEPACLSPNDTRMRPELRGHSILLRQVAKYGNPATNYDERHLARAMTCVRRMIMGKGLVKPEILSVDAAINGDPMRGYKSMDMGTSPGYPYETMGKKTDFFTGGPGEYRPGEFLSTKMAERLTAAIVGNRVESYWADIQKDERRPLEKIWEGKTRMITKVPLDFLILTRQYFLAFVEAMQRADNPILVGMDVSSLDWHRFVMRLKKHSCFLDGDISNNDGQTPAILMYKVCELMNEWYDDDPRSKMVRLTLFDEIVNTVEIAGNCVYLKGAGNPSGQPLTTVSNSIANLIQMAYTFYELAAKSSDPEALFYEYDQESTIALYGDDNVSSVSERASRFFDPRGIAESFDRCGRKYTSARKDGILRWSTLDQISFLKRRIAVERMGPLGTFYVSLLDENVIRDMVCWVRNREDPVAALVDNVNSALVEWSHYGKQRFEEERALIVTHFDPVGYYIYTWDHCFSQLMQAYTGAAAIQGWDECPAIIAQGGEVTTQNVTSSGEGVEPPIDIVSRPTMALPDVRWSLQEAVGRMTYNSTWQMTTSQAAGTGIAQIAVYADTPTGTLPNAVNSTLMGFPFSNFLYARGDCKVRVDVTGSKYHVGTLLAGFSFLPVATPSNCDALTGSAHALIDVSGVSSTIIEQPFWSPFHATNTDSPWVYFSLYAYQQLTAAIGADNTISISVSFAFPGCQFFLPRVVPLTNPIPGFSTRKEGGIKPMFHPRTTATERWLSEQGIRPQGNSASQMSSNTVNNYGNGTVENTATGDSQDAKNSVDPTLSAAVGIDGSTPTASTTAAIHDGGTPTDKIVSQDKNALPPRKREALGLANVASARSTRLANNMGGQAATGTAYTGTNARPATGNMDLEGRNWDPPYLIPQIHPNIANSCNTESVYQLRRYPGSEAFTANADFQAPVDEMRVDYLVRRPGWFATYNITSSEMTNAYIAAFQVTPGIPFLVGQMGYVAPLSKFNYTRGGGGGVIPWCTLLSMYSTYWKGDLEFTFRFTASAFTTGRIVISYSPMYNGLVFADIGPLAATNLVQAANTYSVVYDLADQSKRITIRVPWLQPHQCAKTVIGPNAREADYATMGLPFANGFISVIVQDPITTNTGAPTTINMDCYIAGGPNFQLAGPCGQMAFSQYDDITVLNNPWAFPATLELATLAPPTTTVAPSSKYPTYIHTDIVPQGNDEISTGAESTNTSAWSSEAIVIGPAQHESQIAAISGERFASLRDLLKCRVWNSVADYGFFDGLRLYCNNLPFFMLRSIPWPVLSAYAGIRGSVRLTITIDYAYATSETTPSAIGWAWLPNLYDFVPLNTTTGRYNMSDIYFGTLLQMAMGTDNIIGGGTQYSGSTNVMGGLLTDKSPSVTIEVPYQYITRVFNTWEMKATSNASTAYAPQPEFENPWGWLIFGFIPANVRLRVAVGFGDDMRLGRLYRNPVLIVETAAIGNPQWADV